MESTAFNGISTNLVVYLETVLHGSNLASASNVTTWFGTSYLTPVFGAIIADTFWGNYNTILVSLAVYLLGMMLVTFSAFLPTTTAALCAAGASCSTAAGTWAVSSQTIAFVGLYLVAIGAGGVRSSLLPFGAEQFDDQNAADRDGKASFFSFFYLCVSFKDASGSGPSAAPQIWAHLSTHASFHRTARKKTAYAGRPAAAAYRR